MPIDWILASNWSDQKYGTGTKAVAPAPASRLAAACTPCSAAFVRCSSRTVPSPGAGGQRAMSPAAATPGAASSVGAHTTPSASSSPEPASQAVSGTTPTATSTTSAPTSEPSSRRTASTWSPPTRSATPTPVRTSTPWSAWTSPITPPMSGPSTRRSGAACGSTTVTSAPSPRRRRDLHAEEAPADDNEPHAGTEQRPQAFGVLEPAQRDDPGQRVPAAQRARHGSRRDDEAVEGKLPTGFEHDCPGGRVDGPLARRARARDRGGRALPATSASGGRAEAGRRGTPSRAAAGRRGGGSRRRQA